MMTMVVEVPAAIVYIGTAAAIMVCALFAILLYFLIKISRVTLTMVEQLEERRRQLDSSISRVQQMLQVAIALFK